MKRVHDVPTGSHSHPPLGPSAAPSWQFLLRVAAVLAGLTLLLIVDVHGVAFYIAWTLIVLALLSEIAATLVYWRRSRRSRLLRRSTEGPGSASATGDGRRR
jgi:hypothetical protein